MPPFNIQVSAENRVTVHTTLGPRSFIVHGDRVEFLAEDIHYSLNSDGTAVAIVLTNRIFFVTGGFCFFVETTGDFFVVRDGALSLVEFGFSS